MKLKSLGWIDRIALAAMLGTVASTALVSPCIAAQFPAAQQRLTDDAFRQIVPGATEAQVSALIGPPARKEVFHRTRRTAWDYPYRDTWGYEAEFSVTFDSEGRVVETFSKRDSG